MTPIGKATQWNTVTMSMNDLQPNLESMDVPHNHIGSKTKPDTNENILYNFKI